MNRATELTIEGGTCSINGGPPAPVTSVRVEQEQIDITTRWEPDPNWEHVDPAGHFHAWTHDGQLPTLRATREHRDCNGACGDPDCEGYAPTVYTCTECHAEVEPGMRETSGRKYMPGMQSWQIEVRQLVVPDGARVSVTIQAGGQRWFGFAAVGRRDAECTDGAPVVVRTTLHGVGPLGRR